MRIEVEDINTLLITKLIDLTASGLSYTISAEIIRLQKLSVVGFRRMAVEFDVGC